MATRELTATVFYEAGELTYNFPFDYLKKSFVKAKYIENIYDVSEIDITEELTYGIDYNIEEKQLILKDTTGAKKYIMIYRETSTTPIVDFSDSSILTASNLNVSDLQKYMIIDELADYLIIHGRISLTDEDVKNIKLVDELPDVSVAYEPDIYIVKGSREGYQKFNNKWNLIFAPKASSLEDYDTLIKRVETSKTGEANKISFANSDGKLPNNITGSPDKLLGKTIVAVVDIPEGTCLVYRSSANDGQGGFVLEKVSPTSVINDEEESISTTYSSQKINSELTSIERELTTNLEEYTHIRKNSFMYTIGDISYLPSLASYIRLECCQEGTTAETIPEEFNSAQVGQYITDGNAKWIVCDIRDGLSLGDVAYRPVLKAGYVKLNGATVQRADYPRLVKYAIDNNLWTDSPTTEIWKFGNGDGSTTFVLPDYRNVFIEGGDTPSKMEAGLPNITGYAYVSAGDNHSSSGSLYYTGETVSRGRDGSNWIDFKLYLDASKSSSIYGNAETVQPPSIVLIPQIKY